ncbi:flagellar hook-associated protein FlgK [Fuchsiella alkaliacetigena]|uniref:flagellar hook-associated protein FlgK n=1 Tax=Fuchsiella alkaliacetigena TaxID=957042 RepID=UPI00200AEC49|nr:flagellar hook-associated protein FlgK [Fuchsiella alkaliacetigena]MCK8824172.1 flagellar hook-associated protein FlgK [Fuchsiella alkaliacetigena]
MSTFGGIEIGKRALQTQQKSLDVTGHNIANANTEGYSRQRAIQQATQPHTMPGLSTSGTGAGQKGTGVEVDRIERMRDQFIDNRLRHEKHSLGEWSAKWDGLREIESIYNELEDGGLVESLNEFWNAFQELNNNPESMAVRSSVVQTSVNLTSHINQLDKELGEYREHIAEEVESNVEKVNYYTGQIADLNNQIRTIQADSSKSANDLMDRRDKLIDELSELADIKVTTDDLDQTNVSLDGSTLVQGSSAYNVEVLDDERIENVEYEHYAEDGDGNDSYTVPEQAFEVNGNPIDINGGEIKGQLDVKESVADQQINKLGDLARGLATEVNSIHEEGYDLNGDEGLEFFKFNADEFKASHLEVNEDIVEDPAKLAAARLKDEDGELITGDLDDDFLDEDGNLLDVGNGDNAMLIANLKDAGDKIGGTTFNDYWESEVSKLGLEIDQAQQFKDNQENLTQQLENKREEVSGVSIDEEMTEMIKFQHGYSAAGRLVSQMDEMFDHLIGMVR